MAILLTAVFVPRTDAGQVVLSIMVGNPTNTTQKVQVRSNLPARIGTNDIINAAGLDVGYDIHGKVHYVHKEIELEPKQVMELKVILRDVWVISPDETGALRRRAAELNKILEATADKTVAARVKESIDAALEAVDKSQAANVIQPGVDAMRHIRAYETDLEKMRAVGRDIGHLENLVLSAGLNPQGLTGDLSGETPLSSGRTISVVSTNPVVFEITCQNIMTNRPLTMPIRRDLPPEIGLADVINSGGLAVGADPAAGVCYVYTNQVEIGPGQTVKFAVTLRDKWNVHIPRVASLREGASNLLSRISSKAKFDWVDKDINGILTDLNAVEKIDGPKVLSDKYVAFYTDQGKKIDEIERRLQRIETALKRVEPGTKLGFKVKAPSFKTTWLIIYIILGFLMLVSFMFFLRWYGRTEAETLDSREPAAGENKSGEEGGGRKATK